MGGNALNLFGATYIPMRTKPGVLVKANYRHSEREALDKIQQNVDGFYNSRGYKLVKTAPLEERLEGTFGKETFYRGEAGSAYVIIKYFETEKRTFYDREQRLPGRDFAEAPMTRETPIFGIFFNAPGVRRRGRIIIEPNLSLRERDEFIAYLRV